MGIESHRHRNETARRRWGLLARALQNNNHNKSIGDQSDQDEQQQQQQQHQQLHQHQQRRQHHQQHCYDNQDLISVRRISNFGLIQIVPIDSSIGWYNYSVDNFVCKVRHLNQTLTPEDLIGFNNTGNVCVWPSEEVLAYYALTNLKYFDQKRVLELGAGMSALAGIYIAKYSGASLVTLTDGNSTSLDNIKIIVKENNLHGKHITCDLLRWGQVIDNNGGSEYDLVLAADCLFFDATRKDLVHTMWHSMRFGGAGLVTAPRRGTTLDQFIEEANNFGFKYCISDCYNKEVWRRHTELLRDCPHYDYDIHYPVLILLTKTI